MRNHLKLMVLLAAGLLVEPLLCLAQSQGEQDFLYAKRLYQDGMDDASVEQLSRFLVNFPRSVWVPEAQFLLGETYFRLGSFEDARRAYQRLAGEHPRSEFADRALYKVGLCFQRMDRLADGAFALMRLKDFYPNSGLTSGAFLLAATFFAQNDDLEEAERTLRTMLAEYPQSDQYFRARITLGQLLRRMGKPNQALRELGKVTDNCEDPTEVAWAHLLKAEIFAQEWEMDRARQELTKIRSDFPNTPYYHPATLRLGELALHQGAFSEAEKLFDQLTRETDQDSLRGRAHERKGDGFYLQGRYRPAGLEYQKVKEKSPRVHFKLGLVYDQLGQFDRAVMSWDQAARRENPWKEWALLRLTGGCSEKGDRERSNQYGKAYLSSFHNGESRDRVRYLMGENFRMADQWDAALNSFQLLLQETSLSSLADDAAFALAQVYEEMGDVDHALTFYLTVVDSFGAGEFRKASEDRVRYLKTFVVKSPDSGLKNLNLLITETVEGREGGKLLFNLGMLYFKDLKEYEKAIVQFKKSLTFSQDIETAVDAWYYLANSYRLLGLKKEYEGDRRRARKLKKKAVIYYQDLIKNYPRNRWSADAAAQLYGVQLELKGGERVSPSVIEGLVRPLRELDKRGRFSDLIWFRLGESYFYLGRRTRKESNRREHFQNAVTYFDSLIVQQPGSRWGGHAVYQRGLSHLELGDTAAAKSDFEGVVYHHPRSQWVLPSYLELIRLAQSNLDERISYYKIISEKLYYTPEAKEVPHKLAAAYAQAGRFQKALEIYLTLGAGEPDPIWPGEGYRFDYEIAGCYEGMGDSYQAEKYYKKVLSKGPGGPHYHSALYTLGDLYYAGYQLELAIRMFSELLGSVPEAYVGQKAREKLADIHFQLRDYSKARALYSELVQRVSNPEILRHLRTRLIICLYRTGELKEAKKRVKAFKKDYPDTKEEMAGFYLEKGIFLGENKEFDEAEKAFLTLVKHYPETDAVAKAKYQIGRLKIMRNDLEGAVSWLRDIPKDHPHHSVLPELYLTLGTLYYRLGDYPGAVKAYKWVVENGGTGEMVPIAMNNLIGTYKEMKYWEAALDLTEDYLARFPESEDAFQKKMEIGSLYRNMKDYDFAISTYRDLLPDAGSEDEAALQFYIGECYYHKGQYEQAVLEFLKVKYLGKRTKLDWAVTALYNAGMSYERLHKYDQAERIYNQIIDQYGAESNYGRGARKRLQEMKSLREKRGKDSRLFRNKNQ
ncbi:tetratricopeptide repeat protein [candidate division KSB1 bacterium]|nr:tetratricopeptide repeat protein [candidate division KSB1 bacterium]